MAWRWLVDLWTTFNIISYDQQWLMLAFSMFNRIMNNVRSALLEALIWCKSQAVQGFQPMVVYEQPVYQLTIFTIFINSNSWICLWSTPGINMYQLSARHMPCPRSFWPRTCILWSRQARLPGQAAAGDGCVVHELMADTEKPWLLEMLNGNDECCMTWIDLMYILMQRIYVLIWIFMTCMFWVSHVQNHLVGGWQRVLKPWISCWVQPSQQIKVGAIEHPWTPPWFCQWLIVANSD